MKCWGPESKILWLIRAGGPICLVERLEWDFSALEAQPRGSLQATLPRSSPFVLSIRILQVVLPLRVRYRPITTSENNNCRGYTASHDQSIALWCLLRLPTFELCTRSMTGSRTEFETDCGRSKNPTMICQNAGFIFVASLFVFPLKISDFPFKERPPPPPPGPPALIGGGRIAQDVRIRSSGK